MYNEGAGREVQAAGSSRSSHAEGAEVSPTTEGQNNAVIIQQSQLHSRGRVFF